MNKLFVPAMIALLLKKAQLDVPCARYIYHGNTGTNQDQLANTTIENARNHNNLVEGSNVSLSTSVPTYSQAIDFLEEKHKLFVNYEVELVNGVPQYSGILRAPMGESLTLISTTQPYYSKQEALDDILVSTLERFNV